MRGYAIHPAPQLAIKHLSDTIPRQFIFNNFVLKQQNKCP